MNKLYRDYNHGVKRTSCRYISLVTALILVSLSVIGLVGYILFQEFYEKDELTKSLDSIKKDFPNSCTTNACIRSASYLMDSMDTSLDPCEDFYEYACGNWKLRNPIDSKKYHSSKSDILANYVDMKIKSILETPGNRLGNSAIYKARQLYKACMNAETEITPEIRNYVRTLDWPALFYPDNNTATNITLHSQFDHLQDIKFGKTRPAWESIEIMKAINQLAIVSDDTFINVYTIQNNIDSKIILQIHPNFHSEYFYRQFTISEIHNICFLLGMHEDALESMNEVKELNDRIVSISIYDDNMETYTLDELYTNITNKFDWKAFLTIQLSENGKTFDENELIAVTRPHYFKLLFDIFETVPTSTIKNMISWHHSLHVMSYSLQIVRSKLPFRIKGELWKKCLVEVKQLFQMPILEMYSDLEFKLDYKSEMQDILHRLIKEFINMIQKVQWMNSYEKEYTIEKAKKLTHQFSYSEYFSNETKKDNFYDEVIIDSDQYLKSIINARKFQFKMLFALYGERDDKTYLLEFITYYLVDNIFTMGLPEHTGGSPSSTSEPLLRLCGNKRNNMPLNILSHTAWSP